MLLLRQERTEEIRHYRHGSSSQHQHFQNVRGRSNFYWKPISDRLWNDTPHVIKKPWTTLNDSLHHLCYIIYIVTLLHYIIYSYHHHWIPRSWHLQWDHQEVAAPLSPNDWSVTTMPVPELATSVNFGLLSLEATRMDLVGFVNAALLMNFKYFKRSFLVSCLTQVLAYSDLQDNVAVFAHGMHVTNCDYSCHFSVWKSKAQGRSSCVRLLYAFVTKRELRYQSFHILPLVNRMSRYNRSSKQWLATSLLGRAFKMRVHRVWSGTGNLQ